MATKMPWATRAKVKLRSWSDEPPWWGSFQALLGAGFGLVLIYQLIFGSAGTTAAPPTSTAPPSTLPGAIGGGPRPTAVTPPTTTTTPSPTTAQSVPVPTGPTTLVTAPSATSVVMNDDKGSAHEVPIGAMNAARAGAKDRTTVPAGVVLSEVWVGSSDTHVTLRFGVGAPGATTPAEIVTVTAMFDGTLWRAR